MKITMKVEKEYDVKTLHVFAAVRYPEDAEVNGEPDEEGNMPCLDGETWSPIINIETGQITNWTKGVIASIHYKVCDSCGWELRDADGNTVVDVDGDYVPGTLCPKENGYGDYIIMDVDEDGFIKDWEFDPSDFSKED